MMKAFTLVEVLIVVVILAILAAVVVPQFSAASDDAYMVAAKGFEKALQSGVSAYLQSQKKLPTTFWNWVAFSDSGTQTNSVRISGNIRSQLTNPTADVASSNGKTITLNFKNGLVGVYKIDDAGMITATYQSPEDSSSPSSPPSPPPASPFQ